MRVILPRRAMDPDDKDFAREALNGFFRHRGEAGTFYCTACLVERLPAGILNISDPVHPGIFTMLHEAVHFVLRDGGLCDLDEEDRVADAWARRR
jgi:hypothetical protein